MNSTDRKLTNLLQGRHSKTISPQKNFRRAAVLVPILERDGKDHLLFIKRTNKVPTHQGQISFPGGGMDKSDTSPIQTALRETKEEVGIDPSQVKVIGVIDDATTMMSRYIVTPVVGRIPPYPELKISEFEIEEVFTVPLAHLLDPANFISEGQYRIGEQTERSYYYTYRNHTIWGATARILHQFLKIYQEAIKKDW